MGFFDWLSGSSKDKNRPKRRQKHPVWVAGLGVEMTLMAQQSSEAFRSMPTHIGSAEEQLNQAERYFDECAYVPFWESVETATKTLARFDELIGDLREKASRYAEAAKLREDEDALDEMAGRYVYAVSTEKSPNTRFDLFRITILGKNAVKHADSDVTPAPYPLTLQHISKLSDASNATVMRMERIVHAAHRNIHFATIYEQRRTNQILVAGFTNLADALDQMTFRISRSLDDLAHAVRSMHSTLSASLDAIHSDLGEALDMLDNIQRNRKPWP